MKELLVDVKIMRCCSYTYTYIVGTPLSHVFLFFFSKIYIMNYVLFFETLTKTRRIVYEYYKLSSIESQHISFLSTQPIPIGQIPKKNILFSMRRVDFLVAVRILLNEHSIINWSIDSRSIFFSQFKEKTNYVSKIQLYLRWQTFRFALKKKRVFCLKCA